MKKFGYMVFGAVIGAAVSTAAYAGSGLTIFINGNKIDSTNAYISEDRTYIPLRAVAEALGAEVEWNGDNNRINISSKSIAKQKLENNEIIKNPLAHKEEFKLVLEGLANSWNDNILDDANYEKISGKAREALEQILSYKYEFGNVPKALNSAFSTYSKEENDDKVLYDKISSVFEIAEDESGYLLIPRQ